MLRWGYQTFHRAADDVTATDLAAAAVRDALARTGLGPDDLDLVAIATSELPEYLHWDSSAALARELRLGERQTLLLNEGCASGVTGLAIIAGVFAIQPEVNTVVFVAVNRVSEFHRNRMNVNNAVHSDGAVAVVLRRDHPELRWLGTEQFTDPELCDWFRTDYGRGGGAGRARGLVELDRTGRARADPGVFAEESRAAARVRRPAQRPDPGRPRRRTGPRRAHPRQPDPPDPHQRPRRHRGPGKHPGAAVERTNFKLATTHGHMGAADQLVALGQHLERGDVVAGTWWRWSASRSGCVGTARLSRSDPAPAGPAHEAETMNTLLTASVPRCRPAERRPPRFGRR